MAQSSFLRRPAVLLVLALASVSAVVTLMGRLASGPSMEQKRVQLTGGSGRESYPSFSPDGKRLAYSLREAGQANAYHIFVRDLPSGSPKQLTQGENSDVAPVWSPDGATLAFERNSEVSTAYIVIPADGGPERRVAEFGAAPEAGNPLPSVAWTADGKSLVVVRTAEKQPPALAIVTVDGGKVQTLTKPPEGSEGDSTPAVSPAGDAIAFVRGTTDNGGDIWLCDLKGENPRRVTFDDKAIRGLAWTRDGSELIYAASRARGWQLWRIPAGGGSPRDVQLAGSQAYFPAVGRNRLAYADSPMVGSIWRARIGDSETPTDERPLLRSTGRESAAMYSPDGSKIVDVSDQTGNDEIYLQDADGRNRVQLTHLNRPRIAMVRWSPDGKQLIFDASMDQNSEVLLMGATPGAAPTRVLINARNAAISHNGKSIYYQSRGQIYKSTIAGANPQTISRMQGGGIEFPVESADGKYVFYRARRSFWRVPVEGGDEEEFIAPEHDPLWAVPFEPAKTGLYYVAFERAARGRISEKKGFQMRFGGQFVVCFHDFASKKESIVMRAPLTYNGRMSAAFSVSPDGKYVLFPKIDASQTNLMVVENFK